MTNTNPEMQQAETASVSLVEEAHSDVEMPQISGSSYKNTSERIGKMPIGPVHRAVNIVNEPNSKNSQKTIVIFGNARGGTSAIAGLCRELGIVFCDNAHPLKHEWTPIVYSNEGVINQALSIRNISNMNNNFDVWGWKSPRDMFAFDQISSAIRNPHIIIIFRNMADIIASSAHHELLPFETQAEHIGEVQNVLGQIVSFGTDPMAIISYERMIENPLETVQALIEWLGLRPSVDQIAAATRFCDQENRIYKPLASSNHDGTIDEKETKNDQGFSHLSVLIPLVAKLNANNSALIKSAEQANIVVDHLKNVFSELVYKNEELSAVAKYCGANILCDLPALDLAKFLKTELFDDIVEEKIVSDEGDPLEVATPVNEIALLSAHAAYAEARRKYFEVVKKRRYLQNVMDDLSQKIALVESKIKSPSRISCVTNQASDEHHGGGGVEERGC